MLRENAATVIFKLRAIAKELSQYDIPALNLVENKLIEAITLLRKYDRGKD